MQASGLHPVADDRQRIVSPCDLCIAGCCRSFNLVIDGFDAYRLARSLTLRILDFAELRWAETADDEHRIVLDGNAARHYRMVLIRVPDLHPEHPLRCVFLINVGDRARCGVYDLRPGMCRTYPSHVSEGLVATNGGKYCPPNAWRLETMNLPYFRLQHQFKAQQRAIYHRLIEHWNNRVSAARRRTSDDFFAYLVHCYSQLEGDHPDWFQESSRADDPLPAPHELRTGVDAALEEVGWPAARPDGDA